MASREGDLETAQTLHEQSLATIRQLGDRWTEAFALDAFGRGTSRAGDREGARVLHREALAMLEALGDRRGIARVLTHLAELALADGDGDEARELFRRGLAIRQDLGDMPGLASAMESLAGAIAIADAESATRLHGAANRSERRSGRWSRRRRPPPMTRAWPSWSPSSVTTASRPAAARGGT